MQLNEVSTSLILRFEVGGGESYYNRFLRYPTWPRGESGVTIGVGYDLGYYAVPTVQEDWGAYLGGKVERLVPCVGKKGVPARDLLAGVKDVDVPWPSAFGVYEKVTIPKFWRTTCSAFPGVEEVNPNCQGALLSLVFNRGAGMEGDRG